MLLLGGNMFLKRKKKKIKQVKQTVRKVQKENPVVKELEKFADNPQIIQYSSEDIPIKIKQVVYGAAKTEKREGYQILASYPGMDWKVESKIKEYSVVDGGIVPVDFDFKEATKFYKINKDYYGFTRVINEKKGYDGRPNAIYSHTLLIPVIEFEKSGFNFKALDKYFFFNKSVRGELKDINAEIPRSIVTKEDLETIIENFHDENTLARVIDNIVSHRKQILRFSGEEDRKDIIYSLLSLIPSKFLKNYSYTTLDVGASEGEYNLYVLPKGMGFGYGYEEIDVEDGTFQKPKYKISRLIAHSVFERKPEIINSIKEYARKNF